MKFYMNMDLFFEAKSEKQAERLAEAVFRVARAVADSDDPHSTFLLEEER